MLQVGRDPDFAQEPFGAKADTQLLAEHLDGDLAVMLDVIGQPYDPHAAAPELALEHIAAVESLGQRIVGSRHHDSCGWGVTQCGVEGRAAPARADGQEPRQP